MDLVGKKLTSKETSEFWKSGRDFDKILRNWGIIDVQEFWDIFDEKDFQERIKMIEEGTCFLFPDALEILESLDKYENIKKGIISNTPPIIAEMELEKLELPKRYFNTLLFLGTQQQKIAKPNPESIKIALKQLNTKNHNTFIIGDTILDILAGKNANIHTIFIRRDHNKMHELNVKPDHEIENLNEICSILKNFNAEGGI